MSQNRSVIATFNSKTGAAAPPPRSGNFTTPGTEKELFCDIPVAGGYTHEMFEGPDTARPPLPMVNAKNVLNWRSKVGTFLTLGFGGKRKVDIEISCKTIYIANVLDYKGNIPGLNTIVEPYEPVPDDTTLGEDETGGCDAGIRILAEDGPPPSYEGNVQAIARATLSENPDLASAPRSDKGAGEQLVDKIVAKLRAAGFRAGGAKNCNGVRNFDENIIVGRAGTKVNGQDLGEFYSLFRVEDGIDYQEASNKRSGGMFVEYADYPRCKDKGC
jgi:hypothetical protein